MPVSDGDFSALESLEAERAAAVRGDVGTLKQGYCVILLKEAQVPVIYPKILSGKGTPKRVPRFSETPHDGELILRCGRIDLNLGYWYPRLESE